MKAAAFLDGADWDGLAPDAAELPPDAAGAPGVLDWFGVDPGAFDCVGPGLEPEPVLDGEEVQFGALLESATMKNSSDSMENVPG
jgi:hypothetical protein